MREASADEDECKRDKPVCKAPAKCENTAGSYRCVCPEGTVLSESRDSCRGWGRGPKRRK